MSMRARHKIRPPRRGLGPTKKDEFEVQWALLATSLNEINTKNSSELSFEELYRNAYKMALMPRGEELFGRVKQLEEEWLKSNVRRRVIESIAPVLLIWHEQSTDVQDQSNERKAAVEKFLGTMKEVWDDHLLCMSMMTDVLMYMDRVSGEESIFDVAMALFRDHVLRVLVHPDPSPTVASVLVSSILFMVQLERTGQIIDRGLIRSCAYLLEGLYESDTEDEGTTLYLTVLEPAFLEASRAFYMEEAQTLLANGDAAAFCLCASRRILEERERAQSTLAPVTESKVLRVFDDCFIRSNIAEVVTLEGTGVWSMLEKDQVSSLKIIYVINARVDISKTAVTDVIKKYIVEMGRRINDSSLTPAAPTQPPEKSADKKSEKGKEKERPLPQQTVTAIQWVHDVLALKGNFDEILEKSFSRDAVLEKAITSSFSEFINMNPRSPEYLSLFFDENLKKGIKGKTESEVDALLDGGITLLRYIKDKDLFENYYKKHLSRRLLLKRAVSMDAERQMISKMKMEVGNQFTQRIEAMFKDMTISEDLSLGYRELVAAKEDAENKPVDLEINVLTSTMWPMESMPNLKNSAAQSQCVFPPEIEELKQSFAEFYLGKHSGRKLSWQANMGTADIRATFRRSNGKVQRYELNVSTHAMVILLLFNDVLDGESLSYEEIEGRTCIPAHDLIRNLQSLAVAPKTRVLKKDPMSKDINPDDRFTFNNEFQSPFMKVRIGVVSGGANKVESADQRKTTEDKMNEERGGGIEAAIVRIMKQRKRLTHSQLMTEVISLLSSRFNPDLDMIKRRIESLIDREYLERLPEDQSTYSYVA